MCGLAWRTTSAANVFAVWRAAWRYVGYWIARRVIEPGGNAGVGSACRGGADHWTHRDDVFADLRPRQSSLISQEQGRRERVARTGFVSPAKGKVERRFHYVETSLLNGRTFDTLAHLNEITIWWLANVADVRQLRDFKETPLERYQRERAHLLPLPAADFDTALVLYRHVNVEGYIAYRLNFYSVPWSYIGQVLPVRVTEQEVIIYSPGIEDIARHAVLPRSVQGVRQTLKNHHPTDDPHQRELLLRQRFEQLGPVAVQFLDGLLAKQVYGKLQAQQLLAPAASHAASRTPTSATSNRSALSTGTSTRPSHARRSKHSPSATSSAANKTSSSSASRE